MRATSKGSFTRRSTARSGTEGLAPGTLVEHYIVQLLASYAAHRIEDKPLALRMLAAAEAPLPERRRQLRDIGDTSLYLSGFWSEHLAGGPVDVDYYIGMGGSAYGELARGGTGWTGDPFSDVFGELAMNFVRFVGALALVSRRMAVPASNQDVVRLYRRWQETKSESAAARLAALGVVIGRGGPTAVVTAAVGHAARLPDCPILARLQLGLEALYRVETRLAIDAFVIDEAMRAGGRVGARAARAAAGAAGRRRARPRPVRRRCGAGQPGAARSATVGSTSGTSPTSAWRSRA